MKSRLNYTYRVVKNGKTVERCQTRSTRRFYDRIRTINWTNKPFEVYLRVYYGRRMCNMGCVCNFYNDGVYETKRELFHALTAFTEKELLEEFDEEKGFPEKSGGRV